MRVVIHNYADATFVEGDHPRDEAGKFGKGQRAMLPSGHKASRSILEGGAKRYVVSHPERTDRHYIGHDPTGKITSHMVTRPKRVMSVKGPQMEEHRTTLTPEEAEKTYKKMHAALRAANE